MSPEERHAIVGRILDFLRGTLLPYAEQEEEWLYPVVGQILGNPQATGPMAHDHIAIRARVIELGLTEDTDLDRLQELLYGLYTLIVVHFWKEEQLTAVARATQLAGLRWVGRRPRHFIPQPPSARRCGCTWTTGPVHSPTPHGRSPTRVAS